MSARLDKIISFLDSCEGPIDASELRSLMQENLLELSDVQALCKFKEDCYQRNAVKRSAWYEALVLCWKPGQRSMIHDHHGSQCAFQIIQGVATEVVCRRTGNERDGQGLVHPIMRQEYRPGQVCVSSSDDIHEISNLEVGTNLVTLHVYTPPLHMRTYLLDTGFDGTIQVSEPTSDHIAGTPFIGRVSSR